LKVYIYAVAPEGNWYSQTVEALGYVSVDIRDMDDTSDNESWFKVHGAGGGCEVKLGLRLQKVKYDPAEAAEAALQKVKSDPAEAAEAAEAAAATATEGDASKAPSSATPNSSTASAPAPSPSKGPPKPLEALQIGGGNELFDLTVRVEYAANLPSLHPPTIGSNGAWFSYQLFKDFPPVQTDQFFSWTAQAPNSTLFQPQPDTFRMQSSLASLGNFLRLNPFAIYLVCNKEILGGCMVPIESLLRAGPTGQFTGSTLTGRYKIKGEMPFISEVVAGDDFQTPCLCFSITLSRAGAAPSGIQTIAAQSMPTAVQSVPMTAGAQAQPLVETPSKATSATQALPAQTQVNPPAFATPAPPVPPPQVAIQQVAKSPPPQLFTVIPSSVVFVRDKIKR
jgi:hypothetical protein